MEKLKNKCLVMRDQEWLIFGLIWLRTCVDDTKFVQFKKSKKNQGFGAKSKLSKLLFCPTHTALIFHRFSKLV